MEVSPPLPIEVLSIFSTSPKLLKFSSAKMFESVAAHKTSCRLCLDMDENLMSVFEVPDLEKMIEQCVQVKILSSDYLPTNVCFKCITEIQNWTKFKTLCDQSQKMLLKTIKTETAENTVALPAASSCIKTIMNDCTNDMDLSIFDRESLMSELEKDDANVSLLSSTGVAHSTPLHITEVVQEIRIPSVREETIDPLKIIKVQNEPEQELQPVPETQPIPAVTTSPASDIARKPLYVKNMDRCYQAVKKRAKKKSPVKSVKFRSHKCELCSKTFVKFAKLLEHDQLKHKDLLDSQAVCCSQCSHVFLDKSRLETHILMLHGERKHECSVCKNVYGSANSLRVHMYQHSSKNKCSLCPKAFNSKTILLDHMDRFHYKNKRHSCIYCDKTFASNSDRRRHERHVHFNIALYKCDSCELSFKTRQQLNNHTLAIHKEEKTFVCEICAERFKTRCTLLNHKKTHDENIDVYTCPICKKVLVSHQGYKMHIKSHRAADKISVKSCHYCDRKFKLKVNLKQHIRKIHIEKSNQVCNFCKKSYGERHTCSAMSKTNGRYSCTICSLHFGHKYSLSRHYTKVHQNGHSCKICSKLFSNKQLLQRHYATIHVDKYVEVGCRS